MVLSCQHNGHPVFTAACKGFCVLSLPFFPALLTAPVKLSQPRPSYTKSLVICSSVSLLLHILLECFPPTSLLLAKIYLHYNLSCLYALNTLFSEYFFPICKLLFYIKTMCFIVQEDKDLSTLIVVPRAVLDYVNHLRNRCVFGA